MVRPVQFCSSCVDPVVLSNSSISRSIEIDGSYLQAYFARAYAYNQIGDKNLAIEDYKFCLMLEPGYGPAREELEKIK